MDERWRKDDDPSAQDADADAPRARAGLDAFELLEDDDLAALLALGRSRAASSIPSRVQLEGENAVIIEGEARRLPSRLQAAQSTGALPAPGLSDSDRVATEASPAGLERRFPGNGRSRDWVAGAIESSLGQGTRRDRFSSSRLHQPLDPDDLRFFQTEGESLPDPLQKAMRQRGGYALLSEADVRRGWGLYQFHQGGVLSPSGERPLWANWDCPNPILVRDYYSPSWSEKEVFLEGQVGPMVRALDNYLVGFAPVAIKTRLKPISSRHLVPLQTVNSLTDFDPVIPHFVGSKDVGGMADFNDLSRLRALVRDTREPLFQIGLTDDNALNEISQRLREYFVTYLGTMGFLVGLRDMRKLDAAHLGLIIKASVDLLHQEYGKILGLFPLGA